MSVLRIGVAALVIAGLAGLAQAAPSLFVVKPPVVSGVNPNTGPDNDPQAVSGQWFIPRQAVLPTPGNRIGQTVRPLEFYDNSLTLQGGGFSSFGAIRSGTVQYIDTDAVPGADTFGIQCTITNDTPFTNEGAFMPGINNHGETRTAVVPYIGKMFNVKLSASFAVDIALGYPANPTPPYQGPGSIVYKAVNHDQLAWYCFSRTQQGLIDPVGNFWVPTWDFGDIDIGQSATRQLAFYVGEAALAIGGPLRTWLGPIGPIGPDKFWNRTDSLKISDWISPDFGPGVAYDVDEKLGSNVSVFHELPEPATLGLLAAAGLVLAMRRRA